jgi:hypothetical protein
MLTALFFLPADKSGLKIILYVTVMLHIYSYGCENDLRQREERRLSMSEPETEEVTAVWDKEA